MSECYKAAALALASIFFQACTPENGNNSLDSAQQHPQSCDRDSVNCGLEGNLYYENSDGFVSHNLKSGEVSLIKEWRDGRLAFGYGASREGDMFIVVVESDNSSDPYDIVEVFNAEGSTLLQYHIEEYSSKSQQKILFPEDYLGLGFSEQGSDTPGLVIYDAANAEVVRYIPDDESGYVTSWDWAKGETLVITKGNSILVADSIDGDFKPLFTSDSGSYPKQVDISPDGTTVAFSLPGNGYSHIYTIDMDGTNLHQLTSTDPSSSHPYDRFPSWSPDGNYLSVVTGESLVGCGGATSCWGKCIDLYIVPAASEKVDLSKADIWPAFEVMKESEFSESYVSSSCPLSEPDWR